MMDIDKKSFDAVIKFIYKTYGMNRFYVLQSFNGNKQLNKTVHWLLNLPETQEDFDKQFSSRSRYNRRIKRKNLEKEYKCEFSYLDKSQFTENFFEDFLEMKRIGYEEAYKNRTAKDMFSDFFSITDAYTLSIDGKIEAYVLYSIIDDEEIYQVNITNNQKYSKYGIGVMLYYYAIENLIKRKFKRVYLGGGEYDYKANSKAIKSNTYEGYFYYIPFLKRIFSIQDLLLDGQEQRYLFFLGMKIPLKKKIIKTDNYADYYKKIKISNRIKKLAKKYKDKKIVIYGAGQMSRILFENYDLSVLNIKYVCDRSYEGKQGEKLYGYNCISPSELENESYDVILVLLLRAGEVVRELKYKNLLNNSKNKIITSFID